MGLNSFFRKEPIRIFRILDNKFKYLDFNYLDSFSADALFCNIFKNKGL